LPIWNLPRPLFIAAAAPAGPATGRAPLALPPPPGPKRAVELRGKGDITCPYGMGCVPYPLPLPRLWWEGRHNLPLWNLLRPLPIAASAPGRAPLALPPPLRPLRAAAKEWTGDITCWPKFRTRMEGTMGKITEEKMEETMEETTEGTMGGD